MIGRHDRRPETDGIVEKNRAVELGHDETRSSESDHIPYVVNLAEVGFGDLNSVGGKGANLGELMRAQLPVPPGFVATTSAYERFLAYNSLEESVTRSLRADFSGGRIRRTFEAAEVPEDLRLRILGAYRSLGDVPVAVRSSATAEDLPGAAFAGQQDTFLNIIEADELLKAIRRCWASLWSERAIDYRARLGIDHQSVKIAVVVQRLVEAESAGVLFTANPVTGARNETVIDANRGLGESVVGAALLPITSGSRSASGSGALPNVASDLGV